MKKSFSRFLIMLTAFFPVLFVIPAGAADNILTNPGFEDGDGIAPWTTDANWALDTGFARTGSNSYSSTSGAVMREVPTAMPGGTYTLTGWLRTSGIGSGTKAAYLCVEWYTNGVWTSGVYISLYGSDTDSWQQFEPRTFSIPATATRVVMGIGRYSGVSGTIWYDDLELNSPVYLYSQIRYPPYHETLLPGAEKKLNIGVKASGSGTYPLSTCSVVIDVENESHESLLHRTETYDTDRDWCDYEYPLASLVPGSYTVTTRLVSGGTEIAISSRTLTVADTAAPLPKVYLDEHNRTVVDGELFFPLGIYTQDNITTATQQLEKMKEAKLNAQLATSSSRFTPEQGAAYLNEAARQGVKVIYNLAHSLDNATYYPGFTPPSTFGSWSGTFGVLQGIVSTFKDYPALLAWYTNDEQDTDAVIDELQSHYDFIRSTDTDHPVYQVLVSHQNLQAVVPNTDILGTDSYPVYAARAGTPDYDLIEQDVDKAGTTLMRSKGNWTVIETPVVETATQTRPATREELLTLSYQALIHGSRGIIFFIMTTLLSPDADPALWQTMCQVGIHLDGLKDIALGMDAPADKALSTSNSSVSVLTRVLENGDIYAMAVNPYTTPADATFTIGSGISVSSYVPIGLPGTTERYIPVTGMSFTDTLEALGTRVYCLYSSSGTGGTVTIYPGEAGKPLAYPAVVTPNGDGKNDQLHIRYTHAPDERMTLKLFDMGGMLVYERALEGERFLGNNEYLAAWDGSDFNGSAVPQGLYLVTLFKGDKTYYKRLVQVLR